MTRHTIRTRTDIAIIGIAALALLAACGGGDAPAEPQANPGLANPASVNCIDKGYTRETRRDSVGNEYGVCMFPDGTECGEWAFFRDECDVGDTELWEPQG